MLSGSYIFQLTCGYLSLFNLTIWLQESLFGAELKNIKGPMMTSGISSKQLAKKQFIDSASFSDSRGTEASINISMDELCGVDSLSMPSTSRVSEVRLMKIIGLPLN